VAEGIGEVEPLSSQEEAVVTRDFDTGDQRSSYVANVDVTDRISKTAFFFFAALIHFNRSYSGKSGE
jgi:hypothetical protein